MRRAALQLPLVAAALAALGLSALVAGCAAEKAPLRATMPDDELRTTIAARFPVGTREPDVRDRLAALRLHDRDLRVYDATEGRPRVLLARVWPAGGRWINDATRSVDWIDLAFVFAPATPPDTGALVDVRSYRDAINYSADGGRLSGPSRGHVPLSWDWPQSVPFPPDPLADSASLLGADGASDDVKMEHGKK